MSKKGYTVGDFIKDGGKIDFGHDRSIDITYPPEESDDYKVFLAELDRIKAKQSQKAAYKELSRDFKREREIFKFTVNLKNNIEEELIVRRTSDKEFREYLGVSKREYENILSGDADLKLSTLIKIAKFFDVTVSELTD